MDPTILIVVILIVIGAVISVFTEKSDRTEWEDFESKRKKAEQEAREKAEQERVKYETARKDYEAALDDLEAEDCKQNRIKALEKGREWCATSREYAHGNKSVTVVDEVSITNDINARTCD